MAGPGDPFTYNTIEVPTVVGLLRNILTQYPDNGQIIKELVQNAEDAGATKVEVVHDARNLEFPEAQLVVQRFLKGPGLYLYNNEVFTEQDWHGIRKLSDSIKKNDPLKVGQFGLGFKSVFHFTDYVTILSGHQVLFMDPSEPEDKMCRSISLDKLTEVLPAEACQRSLGGYLTTEHLASHWFPATVFWFPLRQVPSQISDTIYSPEHVKRLFDSFSVEAPTCLTFLKSLETVSLGTVTGPVVNVTHCVELTGPDLEEVRVKRRAFRERLLQCRGAPPQPLTCHYNVTIQSRVCPNVTQQTMSVFHLVPGKSDPSWVSWGSQEDSRHMPLVGVAAPIFPPAAPAAKGHIFSFLPLPPDHSNQTNLPVQVNGFFILNQNRRQVKWRTSESSQEPDVQWNENLVSKVVLEAYVRLLNQLLPEATNGSLDMAIWYSLLPSIRDTNGRWRELAENLWRKILLSPILATEATRFLKPHEVITIGDLANWKPQVVDSVKEILLSQNLPLANLPSHVQTSISIVGVQLASVTPQLLRNTLQGVTGRVKEGQQVHLLQYAMSDGRYQELARLPLLPLQDGTWTTFCSSSHVVYLCTSDQAKAFLGVDKQLILSQLPEQVLQKLKEVASSGATQLRHFSPQQHGADLLSKSASFLQQHHPPLQQVQEWLPAAWALLQHLSLQCVEHIPLFPTTSTPTASSLTPLSSAIVVQGVLQQLTPQQVEALTLLGVVVAQTHPHYVRHHELHRYLHSSDARGATQALLKVVSQGHQNHELANHFNAYRSDEQSQALCNIVETNGLQPSLKNLLAKLNIFKARDRHNTMVSTCISVVNMIVPETNGFPVNYPQTLLTPSLPQEQALALALGAQQMSKEELCVFALQNTYTSDHVIRLADYILGDSQLMGSLKVRLELQRAKFVPDCTGVLHTPSQLYDPEDSDCDVLIGEVLSPDRKYKQHYHHLRLLGLQKVQDMPLTLLIEIITGLQHKQLSEGEKATKSMGLLRAINRRRDCSYVCQSVRNISFVYGAAARPEGYPMNLEWATYPGPQRPESLRSCQDYKDIVGSVIPLVTCPDLPSVVDCFGWRQEPHIELVVDHLRKLKDSYQLAERGNYFQLIKKTYEHLSARLAIADSSHLQQLSQECSVFTEHGFKRPGQVYIWSGQDDLQLLPYLWPLPFELREFESLFLYLGCYQRQCMALYFALLHLVKESYDGIGDKNHDRDRRLVVSVLGKMEGQDLSGLPGPLLLPVETEDDSLELADVEVCSYSEGTVGWIDSTELGVKIVHRCVGTRLARALGVVPLQNHLSAGGEAVIEWGQREPLTTRLHNLLRHYRDGVSLFKELLQNADDAGGTILNLMYDERYNKDSRTTLLGQNMEECQGPALWAHNDATFTDEDFANLREVGGGTKEHQPTKIGKFGLGFCSVYNLTDVPSFVSGSSYVVFDPHMTHLDHTRPTPGLRFNFKESRNSYMLKTLQSQFKPFSGVFGCDLPVTGTFPGTLFRFPLRTPGQAATSKISNISYSRRDVLQLLQMFSKVLGQLLLFTQNIKAIRVFHLSASASSPSEMVELFQSFRNEHCLAPCLYSDLGVANSCTPVQRANLLFKMQAGEYKWSGSCLEETSLTQLQVSFCKGGREVCDIQEGSWSTTWLVCWHSGSASTCTLAEKLGGKALSIGAVAVPLEQQSDGWQPKLIQELPPGFYKESHFHCFLPLPVKTSLPVQLNGFFEVASDRTGLLIQTEDDRHTLGWNKTLMEDAVACAYLTLVKTLRQQGLSTETPYHAVWPIAEAIHEPLVTGLSRSFYRGVVEQKLDVFRSNIGWHPLSKCLFLEDSFLCTPQVGDIAFEFMESILRSSDHNMIKLPLDIQNGFDRETLRRHIITKEVFFQNYFIPNIASELVSQEKRDQLTLHVIDNQQSCLHLLYDLACVPTQPNGTLKPPRELVDPNARIGRMFSVKDERFPMEHFLKPRARLEVLETIGLSTSNLPREMVAEQAGAVPFLPCPLCAEDRAKEVLHYMTTQEAGEQSQISEIIRTLPFLPVMPKPSDWTVPWQGDSLRGEEPELCEVHARKKPGGVTGSFVFDCPSALCLPAFSSLVGSSHLLLDSSVKNTPFSILKKLGVITDSMNLPLTSVIEQLKVYSAHFPSGGESILCSHRCHDVYKHFEAFLEHVNKDPELASGSQAKLKKLKDNKILLTRCGFKEPNLFAWCSKDDCAPDLFSVRSEGLQKYKSLMKTLSISENYSFDMVKEALLEKRETYKNNQISNAEVSQMSRLLFVLFQVTEKGMLPPQGLHLPDTQSLLRPVEDLCVDDGLQLSSGVFHCLHKGISVSQDMLQWLGIQSKVMRRLQQSSNRLHFGQKEPLTTRLRNILNEYPCDSGIMKELLQNADDAGATEVAFILDSRNLPDKNLFDKQWAPLQGLALSVYNNKEFTEQDLQSIQDLGNSCKREDPATTGQYGIGFNAVYHLTDAPSFLTWGPGVPQGETLCMFDPHCWYDPNATLQHPGVQMVNLKDLRKDHPDSFIGYLEGDFPQEEGTVFRLPLRTTRESLISKEVWSKDAIEKMLAEFQSEMSQCMLFLRNVRKISVKQVLPSGKCKEEYFVQSYLPDECCHLNRTRKYKDIEKLNNPCSIDMVRTSYDMEIKNSLGDESKWLVVQQLGVEEDDSLPEAVQEGFRLNTLNLLPHAGIALLLASKRAVKPHYSSLPGHSFSTSCYLPLPAKSGLPFSVNGHFTLNSSRRDLWTGEHDVKAMWNKWLIKEVLVPIAAHAIEIFRIRIFPSEDTSHMTEQIYQNKIRTFHEVLPSAIDVKTSQWKSFTKWFYEYIRDHEFPFFDVFIPESNTELASQENLTMQPPKKCRKGQLKWHAFQKAGDGFPIYFRDTNGEPCDSLENIVDIFKRLGMKLGCNDMFRHLTSVDLECPLLTPDSALKFLVSWDQDLVDRCVPGLDRKVADTPFHKPGNVSTVLSYVLRAKEFSNSLENLPLLLTNDSILRIFTAKIPVFVSSFCNLLPAFGKEFVSIYLVSLIEKQPIFERMVKEFTPVDLGERLSHLLDPSHCAPEAKLPLKNKRRLNTVWRFVVEYIENKFKVDGSSGQNINWKESKAYILQALGKWALYPVKEEGNSFLIPICYAWRALDLRDQYDSSLFHKLPLPFPSSRGDRIFPSFNVEPFIPKGLNLAAGLHNPEAVLEVLYFHKVKVNSFLKENVLQATETAREILEYFGRHCKDKPLSQEKILSLRIFEGESGKLSKGLGKKLIVLKSSLSLTGLRKVCYEEKIVLTKNPTSFHILELYKFLDPECLLTELDLYSVLILPHIASLTVSQRTFYLENLASRLALTRTKETGEWSESEHKVVELLRRTPFIELNGTLQTVENFYDPSNEVFSVMGVANLPENWQESKWRNLLILAGMIHCVTADKFVEFASSLSPLDRDIKMKSKVLCAHLFTESKKLQSRMPQILDIQFIVPHTRKELEDILPHYKTPSGLVSISESTTPEHSHLVWSTMSLLPHYAVSTCSLIKQLLPGRNDFDTPPVNSFFNHIKNLCHVMQKEPWKSVVIMQNVMESIYNQLLKTNHTFETLVEIPIVHIPSHTKYVPAIVVVQDLEKEILPYLHKAPTLYGKFFPVFERLGMHPKPTCDTYAQVLKMIHDDSQQQKLHPEEAKSMKLALKGLVKDCTQLKDLAVLQLFLPARDGTLRQSNEMFVADNEQLLLATEGRFQEPVFIGFEALEISRNDSTFVKQLPERLRPKFISEACQETLIIEGTKEVMTLLYREVQELLYSQEFKTGILRILNHHKHGPGLSQDEGREVLDKLTRVTVRQLDSLATTLTLYGNTVGERPRQYFLQTVCEGNKESFTLYLAMKTTPKIVVVGLSEVYCHLLHIHNPSEIRLLDLVINCLGKPHDIPKVLQEFSIRNYGPRDPVRHFFNCHVGTYLNQELLHLLDNEFCQFNIGEIVCMKKYMYKEPHEDANEDNDTFIIVKVVQVVERHPCFRMFDQYRVSTQPQESSEESCLVTVKAHQLYRFIRKPKNSLMMSQVTAEEEEEEEEDIGEEELFKRIRTQVKEIWKVEDERERRHLLRRLLFKWHPDKNRDRVALCTRVVQYIQSLVGRLEKGEEIPDDEDATKAPTSTPSQAYSNTFQPPPRQYSHRRRTSGSPKTPDHPEAHRWRRQSQHDIETARRQDKESPCWLVLMCCQAAEKMLIAALYLEDRAEAVKHQRKGPGCSLTWLSQSLASPRAVQLADRIENRAGRFSSQLYPTFAGCPCDRFSEADAEYVFACTQELLQVLAPRFT